MGIASYTFLYDSRSNETNAIKAFRRKKKLVDEESSQVSDRDQGIQALRGTQAGHRKIPLGPTQGVRITDSEEETSSSSSDDGEFDAAFKSTFTMTDLLSQGLSSPAKLERKDSSTSSSSDEETDAAWKANERDSWISRELQRAIEEARNRKLTFSEVPFGIRQRSRNNSRSEGD